jgi:hypothetical protein
MSLDALDAGYSVGIAGVNVGVDKQLRPVVDGAQHGESGLP